MIFLNIPSIKKSQPNNSSFGQALWSGDTIVAVRRTELTSEPCNIATASFRSFAK